jgi:hypothetical protein
MRLQCRRLPMKHCTPKPFDGRLSERLIYLSAAVPVLLLEQGHQVNRRRTHNPLGHRVSGLARIRPRL